MTRKRFKKLLMSRGYGRRSAEVIAWLEWLLRGNYAESWTTYLRAAEDPQGPQGVGPYEETGEAPAGDREGRFPQRGKCLRSRQKGGGRPYEETEARE